MGSNTYVKQCKTCNSKFRGVIEELHTQGMSPQKIYEYLQSLSDPDEQEIVKKENIKPSSIRRHMKNHFDPSDDIKIKTAETKERLKEVKDKYEQGTDIIIDEVNTISYMIERALVNIEEVEDMQSTKEKHNLTIRYMNSVKGLINSLADLTGELQNQNRIDVNFFSNEITRFAEIVLSTIRQIDQELDMNGDLEFKFAQEFKKQWDSFQERQQKILDGELPVNDGQDSQGNSFNEGV
jgi:ATP:corrinoid adenosyltransferase